MSNMHYIFPSSVPDIVVYGLPFVGVAAWVGAHWVKRKISSELGTRNSEPKTAGSLLRIPSSALRVYSLPAVMFFARVGVAFLTMLAVTQAAMRDQHLILATNWTIWPIVLFGAIGAESVLSLYGMERKVVTRRLGLALTGLRVALLVLVIAMLLQPVRPWDLDKTIHRYVAVLVDNSASMYVPDTQLAASEKIRLASRFSNTPLPHLHGFDSAADDLESLRADLVPHAEWLASVGGAQASELQLALQVRRNAMNKAFSIAEKKADDLVTALSKPIDPQLAPDAATKTVADDLPKRLAADVRDRLKEAVALTSGDYSANLGRDYERLTKAVGGASAVAGELAAKAAGVAAVLDEKVYASLTPEQKGRVDAVAAEKRIALARQVLLDKPQAGGRPLLEQLQGKWAVTVTEFASQPVEVNLKDWSDPKTDADKLDTSPSALSAAHQQTDMAAAVEKVMGDMAEKQLSGILLLTDGRTNGSRSVEPLVQRLGVQQVPVSSVVFGGAKPPMDAGVMSVEAPETIAPKDRVLAKAEVKLDGLAGKDVRVSLNDGVRVVDTKTVRVPVGTDTFRTRVELADDPTTKGLHSYAVEVQSFDGEVMTSNNKYPVTVNVAEDQTNVLYIEGRPRWEFRYLKNLFSGRDKTVRMQYVLLEPDKLEGVPALKKIEASVARAEADPEATALPKDEMEWLKFDVIILGDVSPKSFTPEQLKILERFVKDRSGSLIVISGPNWMPHAYVDTPLADLLPVTIKKEDRPYVTPPERSFRIALTPDGMSNVMTEMRTGDEENARVWDRLPDIYWRHPVIGTRPGATVLAYAVPVMAPDYLPQPRKAAADGKPETITDDILRKRDAFARANPIIAYQTVATGQVMFLGTDMTWRLRYRTGDTYHHRFWGQVLRWASMGKLPSGTDTVRLGSDRVRYAPQASVRIKAKIAKKDYTPVNSADDITVNIFEVNQAPPSGAPLPKPKATGTAAALTGTVPSPTATAAAATRTDDGAALLPSNPQSTGGKLILTKKMKYIENSPGMYLADLGELPHGGAYRAEISSPAVKAILAEEKATVVSADFSVDPITPAEQAELVPDRGLLQRMANLTSGVMADPSHAERVISSFGMPTETAQERHEYRLWDGWPLLVLALALATCEWLLRKKGGLV
jgi:hypothetical protein